MATKIRKAVVSLLSGRSGYSTENCTGYAACCIAIATSPRLPPAFNGTMRREAKGEEGPRRSGSTRDRRRSPTTRTTYMHG
jgi:hypothetical protein